MAQEEKCDQFNPLPAGVCSLWRTQDPHRFSFCKTSWAVDRTMQRGVFLIMKRAESKSLTVSCNSLLNLWWDSYSSESFSSSGCKMRIIIIHPQNCGEDQMKWCLWKCLINCEERWSLFFTCKFFKKCVLKSHPWKISPSGENVLHLIQISKP